VHSPAICFAPQYLAPDLLRVEVHASGVREDVSAESERVASYLAAKDYESRYEIGLEVLKSRWRDWNAEDTLRFHALCLHEVGMVKSSPQKLIAGGTDWRFLNELKEELKA